jgi:hypothetical protein
LSSKNNPFILVNSFLKTTQIPQKQKIT